MFQAAVAPLHPRVAGVAWFATRRGGPRGQSWCKGGAAEAAYHQHSTGGRIGGQAAGARTSVSGAAVASKGRCSAMLQAPRRDGSAVQLRGGGVVNTGSSGASWAVRSMHGWRQHQQGQTGRRQGASGAARAAVHGSRGREVYRERAARTCAIGQSELPSEGCERSAPSLPGQAATPAMRTAQRSRCAAFGRGGGKPGWQAVTCFTRHRRPPPPHSLRGRVQGEAPGRA